MSEITAKDIQKLRQSAGVGMMDAKTALKDADGDLEKAYELLRERGQAKMAKRADREANEGTIGTYVHIQNDRPIMGVLVELACETDFVAKSDEFREIADDIAMHISWGRPGWITRDQVAPEAVEKERELIARQAAAEGKPEQVVDKIVDGKIEAWYADNVLYDQKFVNADKFDGPVGELVSQLASKMGENISVRRMARVAVGE
ncbi:MAG: translation elongation factor Ts [Acidimicrobiia bacterium]|nr:translation elongation factor Ts [Acidimicrobiia bacterium]MDH3462987.1 translation elongation factor Ts [Acidimicrobiia bacterium]